MSKMYSNLYEEHPFAVRVRALGVPLHVIKALLGPKGVCESKLSRVLRGIDEMDRFLEANLLKVITDLESKK